MKRLPNFLKPIAWPIAVKLSVAMLSIAIVPMGIASYYDLQQNLERVQAGEYRKLEQIAASNAGRLDQLILDIQGVVVQISTERYVINFLTASSPKTQKPFRSQMQQTLDNVFHSNPDYDAVYLLDKHGACLAATDPTFVGQRYGFREYYRKAIQGRTDISSILLGETSKRPGLYFSSPVRSGNGEVVGVAVLKIKGDKIWSLVNTLQAGSQGYYAFLIDEHGVIISHPNKSFLFHSLSPLPPTILQQIVTEKFYGVTQIKSLNIPDLARVMEGAKEAGHTTYYSSVDQMFEMVGFAPLDVRPWVLGVTKPKEGFTAPLNNLIWQNTSNVFVVGGVAAISALILARSISKPIRGLTRAAQALERDDFDFDPQTLALMSSSQDDMGQLVRVFMDMAQKVKAREQKLKEQLKELHIEVDEAKRSRQVAEVTGTEYFQELQKKAQRLKVRTLTNPATETEYFQHLEKKVQKLKRITSVPDE